MDRAKIAATMEKYAGMYFFPGCEVGAMSVVPGQPSIVACIVSYPPQPTHRGDSQGCTTNFCVDERELAGMTDEQIEDKIRGRARYAAADLLRFFATDRLGIENVSIG